jgi:pyruvate,orthophosphate dikinase
MLPNGKTGDRDAIGVVKGLVTVAGGVRSSCAAIARHFGLPAVVGCRDVQIDIAQGVAGVGEAEVKEGAYVTVANGKIYAGRREIRARSADDDGLLTKILGWADEHRRMRVRACVESQADAAVARRMGAEGIAVGIEAICKGELLQRVFLEESAEALEKLSGSLAIELAEFFRDNDTVAVQLFNDLAQNFLPDYLQILGEVAALRTLKEIGGEAEGLDEKVALLEQCRRFRERNPLGGLRGTRLALVMGGFLEAQLRAVFEGACMASEKGAHPKAEILLPLICDENEAVQVRAAFEAIKAVVFKQQGREVEIRLGAVLETPRATLIAGQIAKHVDFMVIGADNLSQLAIGFSRDDAEAGFIAAYKEIGICADSPFRQLDAEGVGKLIEMAIASARAEKPDLQIGLIGECAADGATVKLCHDAGVSFLVCGPYQVPIARLAAAQAVLQKKSHLG